MADEDVRVLLGSILDYFSWLNETRESKHFREVLIDFTIFSTRKEIGWDDMFTFETFSEFRKYTRLKKTSHALCGLSAYLYDKGAVARPLTIRASKNSVLRLKFIARKLGPPRIIYREYPNHVHLGWI